MHSDAKLIFEAILPFEVAYQSYYVFKEQQKVDQKVLSKTRDQLIFPLLAAFDCCRYGVIILIRNAHKAIDRYACNDIKMK